MTPKMEASPKPHPPASRSINMLSTGEIDYDALALDISKNIDKPIILNVYIGTTVKGAVDNLDRILTLPPLAHPSGSKNVDSWNGIGQRVSTMCLKDEKVVWRTLSVPNPEFNTRRMAPSQL